VFDTLEATSAATAIGFARGRLIADPKGYERWAFVDGTCPLTWRQGLKHDAAAVMELTLGLASHDQPATLQNKRGETVDVERAHVYPLLKGTDLSRDEPVPPRRAVIVTQSRIGEDTRPLEHTAPRLWAYLSRNAGSFAKRKSSIYRDQPPFALFGIGPYSFAPYKVAVSGLHKHVRFHAIGPAEERPVMLDDTSYFVACSSPEHAALLTAILQEEAVRAFLGCLSFSGAKRPVTKALLQRLDLGAIADHADQAALHRRAGAIRSRLLGIQATAAGPAAWPESFDNPPGADVQVRASLAPGARSRKL
jgi:hypothetical protein